MQLISVDKWVSCLNSFWRSGQTIYHIVDSSEASDTKYKSLQEVLTALQTTKKIQTILLRPGIYEEKNLIISTSVSIESVDCSNKDVQIIVDEISFKNGDI